MKHELNSQSWFSWGLEDRTFTLTLKGSKSSGLTHWGRTSVWYERWGDFLFPMLKDFSSAFNTIIPQKLMEKLLLLGLNTATCLWVQVFLTERPQSVRIGNNTSNSITLSTGSPQGCVLSADDCASRHEGNQIIRFAGDTTVVELTHRNEESVYREEVKHLEVGSEKMIWCSMHTKQRRWS